MGQDPPQDTAAGAAGGEPAAGGAAEEQQEDPGLPTGARRMTDQERMEHSAMLFEALAKQGMGPDAVPEDIKTQVNAFVNEGKGCELTINTPKGQIYCRLNNYVPIGT